VTLAKIQKEMLFSANQMLTDETKNLAYYCSDAIFATDDRIAEVTRERHT
jgi:hypothetical protein